MDQSLQRVKGIGPVLSERITSSGVCQPWTSYRKVEDASIIPDLEREEEIWFNSLEKHISEELGKVTEARLDRFEDFDPQSPKEVVAEVRLYFRDVILELAYTSVLAWIKDLSEEELDGVTWKDLRDKIKQEIESALDQIFSSVSG